MSLIIKQYSSRIAVATTIKGSQKIAKISLDPLNSANDRTLKDGITFDNGQVQPMLRGALDLTIPLARPGLSNISFLKEDTLEERLKKSLESYGQVSE